jgi:predicted Zn finger-like uncharacterized protein
MIVTCESCSTKFRLNPERLKGPRSKVKCSRCGHIFLLIQQEEEVMEVNLEDDMDLPGKDSSIPVPLLPPAVPSGPKKNSSRKRWLFWIASVLALAAGVQGLVSYLISRPQQKTPQVSTETPLIKVLDSTQAFFLENSHTGQIFVIEGEIENLSARPVSFILVEGKLFNTTNRVAITQRCYVGNAMTREELARLNMTEIQNRMMYREGKSLGNVKIPPGKRVPFMLVFHNLPELKALSDYSVEIISSKYD